MQPCAARPLVDAHLVKGREGPFISMQSVCNELMSPLVDAHLVKGHTHDTCTCAYMHGVCTSSKAARAFVAASRSARSVTCTCRARAMHRPCA